MPNQPDIKNKSSFSDLGLSDSILKVLDSIGYETPSPIQQECITHLLNGHDIIGQAQTGTGKTAAFALPLLDKIDISNKHIQILILTPTRELAIQVSEAVQTYARGMNGFHVLPIYGGQSYDVQLRPLKRGVHAVVGTPGRVMDHIKKGT
jgi:ATP-dependent RNA helicase DeaD